MGVGGDDLPAREQLRAKVAVCPGDKKRLVLEPYSKGQSYVGYGVAREGYAVFLCFQRFSAAFLVFLPLPQPVHFR